MTALERLRAVEEWLDGAAERGETLAEALRTVSRQILGFELKELFPDRPLDYFLEQTAEFTKMGER